MDLQESSIQLHIVQRRHEMYFAMEKRQVAFLYNYLGDRQKYLIQKVSGEQWTSNGFLHLLNVSRK